MKDEYLLKWMDMMRVATNGPGAFKGKARKECEEIFKFFGFEKGELPEKQREALLEMANKYIKVSLESPDYGARLLGLQRADKDQKKRRMCEDIKKGAWDYPYIFLKVKEAKCLLSVFREAFSSQVENGEEYFDNFFGNKGKI